MRHGRYHGSKSPRVFAGQVRQLFSDVTLISGARPESLSPSGDDDVLVNWSDGKSQQVRIASVHLGAHEIRTRRRERAEFQAYTARVTREAKRQALIRMAG